MLCTLALRQVLMVTLTPALSLTLVLTLSSRAVTRALLVAIVLLSLDCGFSVLEQCLVEVHSDTRQVAQDAICRNEWGLNGGASAGPVGSPW